MKRIKKVVCIICIITSIISLIGFSIPSKSYGICNTINFDKEVSAIRFILPDGQTLYDIGVERKVDPNTPLLPANFKNINLAFVVETGSNATKDNYNKQAMKTFTDKIHTLYLGYSDKIKIGVVPFRDLSQSEINNRTNPIDTSEEILKTSQEDAVDAIENLEVNNERTLQEALSTVQNNFAENNGGSQNNELLQCMILITDGINNGDVNIDVNGVSQNMVEASNVILKDLSNENMVSSYCILEQTGRNSTINKLLDGVLEMTVAENVALSNVAAQLENSAYEYIRQFIIKTSTLRLTGTGETANVAFTSGHVLLIVDEGLMYGSTIQIEYKIQLSRYAQYGNGEIYSRKILDLNDSKMGFDPNAPLLTDSTKKNADYGWQKTNEGIVAEAGTEDVRLVLSSVLTPETYTTFSNTAKCDTSFDVGGETPANYRLVSKAADVVVIPPFGNNNSNNSEPNKNIWIYVIALLIAGVCASIIIKIVKKHKKQNANY